MTRYSSVAICNKHASSEGNQLAVKACYAPMDILVTCRVEVIVKQF